MKCFAAALVIVATNSFSQSVQDPAAQFQMARQFEQEQSYAKAHKWYRRAAEQNFGPAEYRLGRMYSAGLGVRQNYAEELRWMRRAAAHGHSMAQNRLGVMHERGEGVAPELVEAYKWYAMAARADSNAFAVANRQSLAGKLSLEQMAEGERRAAIMLADGGP